MHRILARRRELSRSVVAHISESSRHGRSYNHSISARNFSLLSDSRSGDVLLPRNHPLFTLALRTYSSSTPPDVKPVTLSNTPPIPPPGLKSKPKVELRPGPVKPSTLDSAALKASSNAQANVLNTAPAQSHTEATPKRVPPTEPTAQDSAKIESQKSESASSIVDIAKKDIEEAAQHGILAPPPPDAGIVRRLLHQAKELFKFYFAGLKLIFANGRRVKLIQERIKAGGAPISRAESRFIQTYRQDIVKLIPFVLMILVIEEIIPLVVIYAPGILPSTCILPSQRERIDSQRHERQQNTYKLKRDVFAAVDLSEAKTVECGVNLTRLDGQAVKALCGLVGIQEWGILGMQRRRLSKYLTQIYEDDMHLIAERKGTKLPPSGITVALWERGFIADSMSLEDQRALLSRWLDTVTRLPGPAAADKSACTPVAIRARLLLEMGATGRFP